MNKQRKVVITTTYNEMGIIIDTKAEEVAQPEVAKDTNVLTNDCISRQAVIDALENIDCSDGIGISALKCDVVEDAINAINALPSAQPETAQNVSDGDLISRKAVLDELRFQYDRDTTTDPEDGTDWILYEEAVRNIEKLPSAQPERQKGEWIDYTEDGYVECPFCHNATNCDGNKDELHFCFSCGADMREDEQG